MSVDPDEKLSARYKAILNRGQSVSRGGISSETDRSRTEMTTEEEDLHTQDHDGRVPSEKTTPFFLQEEECQTSPHARIESSKNPHRTTSVISRGGTKLSL